VRALVLVDSAGLDRVDARARLLRRDGAPFAAGARGALVPRWFGRYYRIVLQVLRRAQRGASSAATEHRSSPDLVELRARRRRSASIARALAVPVFVAWARRDRVIQLPGASRSPACFEIASGGHSPFLECPDAFMPALAEASSRRCRRAALAGARDSAALTGAPA
jgi:pimeloyl-ACP methyl ester carboxylesterase